MKISDMVFGLCLLFVGAAVAAVVVIWLDAWMIGGSERVGSARLDVFSLDQAVTAYKLKHGDWPANLKIMTERGPDGRLGLLIDETVLIDPWQRPYHYDSKQLHPTTGKPLIWSDGPAPGPSGIKFSNWDGPTTEAVVLQYEIAAAVIGLVLAAFVWWGWRENKPVAQP